MYCIQLSCVKLGLINQAHSQPTLMGFFHLPPLLSFPLPSPPLPLYFLFISPPLRSRLPIAARRSGGALKLPQQVRAEPGRQTVFDEL